jgi:hypothetical protein
MYNPKTVNVSIKRKQMAAKFVKIYEITKIRRLLLRGDWNLKKKKEI